MKIEIEADDLKPLIESVVAEAMHQHDALAVQVAGRLAYLEGEAAGLMGVPKHTLRDARLRGEIEATKIGNRIAYTPESIKKYLQNNTINVPSS